MGTWVTIYFRGDIFLLSDLQLSLVDILGPVGMRTTMGFGAVWGLQLESGIRYLGARIGHSLVEAGSLSHRKEACTEWYGVQFLLGLLQVFEQ